MSHDNVEIVRRFLLVDIDEALTYADPDMRRRGRGSGIEIDARFYDVYTLRDGKILRMDQFTELADALNAARAAK